MSGPVVGPGKPKVDKIWFLFQNGPYSFNFVLLKRSEAFHSWIFKTTWAAMTWGERIKESPDDPHFLWIIWSQIHLCLWTKYICQLPHVSICCCHLVSQSCPALCNPTDCNIPGFPVLHHLPEFAQTHIHWASDAIPLSHPLLPPSSPALSLSQDQGLFQGVSSLH